VLPAVGARPTGLRLDTTAISYFGFIKIEFVSLMVGITQVNAIATQSRCYPPSQDSPGGFLPGTEQHRTTPDQANPQPSCSGLRAAVSGAQMDAD